MIAAPWYLGAQTLAIGDGAVVTIGVGASVSYGTAASSGTVTSNAVTKLIIESDATGSGSLISEGSSVKATVKRYIPHTSAWNMVTPSTSDVTGQNFYDAAGGSSSWLTKFYEPNGTSQVAGTGWIYITDLDSTFTLGTGFSYWPAVADETVEFKGNLQDGDLTLSTSNDGLSYTTDHGFNLIGNPFPCALTFDSDWNETSVNEVIWIWNGSQYEPNNNIGNSTGDIPVGQGFFVRATGTDASITIPTSKRVHTNPAFLKGSETIINNDFEILYINAYNNNYSDKVLISFGENGTDQYDNGYDAEKMFGSVDAPQLYLVEAAGNQSFDHLPLLEEGESRTVEMGYVAGANGFQTLVADFSSFVDIDVVLEDLFTNVEHDLNQNPVYEFTGSKEDDPNRFLLHFAYSPDGIGDEDSNNNGISIYSYDKQIYISSVGLLNGNVAIYDIMGRELYEQKLHNTQKEQFSINVSNTYVIVQLNTGNTIKTQKVFIK